MKNYLADQTQNVSLGEFNSSIRKIKHNSSISAWPIDVSYPINDLPGMCKKP